MNHLLTIIKKEALDTLRDRRTLIVMILVPVLVFPVIFIAITRLQTTVMEREQERMVRIGWVSEGENERLASFLEAQDRMELIPVDDAGELEQLIRNDSILYGLVVPKGFEGNLDATETASLSLYYSGTQLHGKERIDRAAQL